ncbi:SulP family inorganic anion transporter [Planotetraspora phitsanulokensis]|uniref:MFS transporter n=1 Tax=Planotetraspora phitsanulokensis TaxID=575192 RepID=A0A8J3U3T4_9ACTN|nr:SulP family inorganic anion transporter [Planotetraspora phitsanulokensis]GII36721.1 MFS transporter [Planotetraspora phitsanulokensis]
MTTAFGSGLARVRSVLPERAEFAAMGRRPRRDLLAGLTVAIVALPLALGFGISSGMGAAAGLATAVVAGALAAVFGGSRLQVSGPTGAMTVVLVPIMHQHGASGVLTVGVLAGLLLIALALGHAGKYMALVPAPVVEGFTIGIACVIGLQQIPAALGVPTPEGDKVTVVAWHAVRDFLAQPHWWALAITAAVASLMLAGGRWRPTFPFSLVAVALTTVIAALADLPVTRIGELPAGLPVPSLAFLDMGALPSLVAPAVAVAALAALESLLSAAVADGMSVNHKHDPDRELFGQGLANLAAPLFGGVPATGAIARTAVNVRSGAHSRLAALAHAGILAVIVFTASGLVAHIPLAALAGVLLATSVRMVEVGSVKAMVRSTRGDAMVLVLTAVATLALDLVQAVILGLIVAGALALRSIARDVRLDTTPIHPDLPGDHTEQEHALLAEHIVAYRLDGPLFFAAAHRFLLELSEVATVSVVILRMSRVTTIDASGALVLGDAIQRLERRNITVYVSGIRDGHHQPLHALGVIARLDQAGQVFATTPEAISAARDRLHHAGVLTPVARDAVPS